MEMETLGQTQDPLARLQCIYHLFKEHLGIQMAGHGDVWADVVRLLRQQPPLENVEGE